MSRVTKINVGGKNYDIAHEGTLENSGFEVVTSLPTTGLFDGRQVVYQNRVWVYSNGWKSPNNPVSFPSGVTLRSSTEELNAAARYVELRNFQLEQVPELLNKSLFISNNDNCVKRSDRLYELIDNETGTITVLSDIVSPVLGQTLRYTAINPSYGLDELYYRTQLNGNMYYRAYCIYIPQNIRYSNAIYKIEYYIYTDATGDGDLTNQDNYVWKTVFEKELLQYTEIIYPLGGTLSPLSSGKYRYTYNIRVTVTPTNQDDGDAIHILDIDIKYFGLRNQSIIYSNRLINYDAVIEPSQTGETFKSIPWIMQYLVQGVNWLRAKLANSSMSLNGTEVNLGDTAILPWYVSYNGVDHHARLQGNWLQIYRNEVWANLLYLASQEPALPTEVVQITSFGNLDWYNEQVSEYEIDSNTTFELLDGKVFIAGQLIGCPANQLTLNLYPIPSGRYNKGALDAVIADLQKNNFSVFVENDIDTILSSGNDFCVRIKVSKVPTYKAIIECYVAR